MILSPLEQFSIIKLIPFEIYSFDISFTNSSLFMALPLSLFIGLSFLITFQGGKLIPNAWQSIVEMLYEFLVNLIQSQVGKKGKPYFPIIFAVFSFILFNNLIGMIPYSFTSTSHFIVTFTLSFAMFIGITIIGFEEHGIHYFSYLLPPGAPLILAPFLVVLELISYCFRPISLGVRLFANMMAGHTLVKILSGFSWSMMKQGIILSIVAFIPFGVVFALTFLEIAVAGLQAYVFTILVCIYMNDAICLH